MKPIYVIILMGITLSIFSCKKSSNSSAPVILLTQKSYSNGYYTYAYDTHGMLTSYSYTDNNSANNFTAYATIYNPFGQIQELLTVYPTDSERSVFTYDAKGNIIKMEHYIGTGSAAVHNYDIVNSYNADSMKLSSYRNNLITSNNVLQYECWFDASNNITLEKYYNFNTGVATQTNVYHSFDTKKNPSSLLPAASYFGYLPTNNPTLLTYTNELNTSVTYDVSYSYQYSEDGYPTKVTSMTPTDTFITNYTYLKK